MNDKNPPRGITYYSRISDLSFYVLGNTENALDSNAIVMNHEIMKGDLPMPEGIYDPHGGTTDFAWNCATCGCRKTICPGHFCSLELKYPVKSPMFRDELLKWLKVICYYCGETVAPIKMQLKADKRLIDLIKNIRKNKECHKCGQPHMEVVKDKKNPCIFYRIREENKQIIRQEFFNHEIEQLLQKIKTSTVLLLGKSLSSHPCNFVLRTIRVPPNTIRPDIRRIGGARSSNSDTTSLLKTLVEINETLADEIPSVEQIDMNIRNTYTNLDMTYFAMIKGGGGGEIRLMTNTNKFPVAIAEHFPKKQGRIRRNLMGRRVEYMIRSVITGDSKIRIDEIGIPLLHARNLEIPETVTSKNKDRLNTYFLNKTDRYPGCKRIIKKSDGDVYGIEPLSGNYQLQLGDIVLRDMIDGDIVAFNRQPSLLFSNIVGMRVVIMHEGLTLRLNPAICNYFNADFDGDQMNAIIPCSIPGRNECWNIMRASRYFISPQKQAPLAGAFQDALIGLSELTKDGLVFNKWHAMNALGDIALNAVYNKFNNIDWTFPGKTYTNRDLVSRLLPKINLIDKEPTMYKSSYAALLKYNPNDINVKIIRGELISGVLDKATSGQDVMGSIFHIIANEYGNDTALNTIYNLQQIVHRFFLQHGFTSGISDINISVNAIKEIKRNLTSMILESRKITDKLNSGKLIAPIGTPLNEFYESEQMNVLTNGDDFVNPIFADIDIRTNMMARLILSGSKGKVPNFIDFNGALGVLTINGKRFGPQVGWGRTSPYFVRYDTEPAASGFISTSYREGITSEVYPFVAGQARHGLISNALSTSITGYQNRISIKNLETVLIDNLRKSVKGHNIVQPLYGDCGLNPAKTEKIKIPTVMISNDKFSEYKTKIDQVDKRFRNKQTEELLQKEFEQIKADRSWYRKTYMTMENHNPNEYIMSDSRQLPVNVNRIIDDTIYNYVDLVNDLKEDEKVLDPTYTINLVNEVCNNLGYAYLNEIQQKKKMKLPTYILTATHLLQVALRTYLSTSYLLKKKVINHLLDIIVQKIVYTFKKSLIDSGLPVGILAAQCISEPLTQYVLDSKHRTGGQGGTKTNAIIRVQEILSVKDTESMKNPHMLIMPKVEYETDKIKVQEIANHIEMMNFGRFITSTSVFFEEYGKPVHPKYVHEADIIKQIEKHIQNNRPGDLARWCIRYGLDKEELILKSMKLETIILAIHKACPELYLIYTPENADDVFIRCYIRSSMLKQSNNYYEDIIQPLMQKISTVIVRGIKDILATSVMDIMKHIENPDGSLELKKVYGIMASGSNLIDVLRNPYIDPYRTQSDSITDTESIFGLIAARNKVMNEMKIALDTLNPIHCSIFADTMAMSGTMSPIQKTGLQKREMANITLRLSFQIPVQIIQDAAINSMTDRISGISGNLIVGSTPDVGTMYNKLVVNEDFVKKNTATLEDVLADL